MREEIPVSLGEFRELASRWEGSKCWGLHHYLGSMLSFDFGERIEVSMRDGMTVFRGARVLSVCDVFWVVYTDKEHAITSNDVDKESFRRIYESMVGSRIESISVKKQDWLHIKFSSGARIAIDLTNLHEDDGMVVGFSENNVYTFAVDADGTFHKYVYE